MNFWTPERCKTIDTLILMDNSCEMSMQAELTNSAIRRARLLENVEMIQAELRTRVWSWSKSSNDLLLVNPTKVGGFSTAFAGGVNKLSLNMVHTVHR